MSNIIDINAYRKKKAQDTDSSFKSDGLDKHKFTVVKTNVDRTNLFAQEGRLFKFMRMTNPPAFVIMNTDVLPPEFPSHNPSPLVA